MQSVESPPGYRFDTGPSLLLLPDKYREAFEALGESLDGKVAIKRVQPAAYRVFFAGQEPTSIDLTSDVAEMSRQLERFEPGASAAYLRFLSAAKEALDAGLANFIERDFTSIMDYLNPFRLLPLLKRLSPLELLGQHHAQVGNYFKDPRLRALFTFQDLYVGLSPYNAPGVFSLLAATELIDGIHYPLGGFGAVRDALLQSIQTVGVSVERGAEVVRIDIEGNCVTGVTLADGRRIASDVVVTNADVPALDVRLDGLLHHSIFLSDEYEKSWNRASDPRSLCERPNFYVHAPARTDPTAAPAGCDAITVLVPVANLQNQRIAGTPDVDAELVSAARVAVIRRFKEAGVGDISSHMTNEFVYTPTNWQDMYNLQHGAAFGLAHGFFQLAHFRPPVADTSMQGLYFVGASTRPGNGVPLVLIGAKLTAERILSDAKRRHS
eukprot:jgi/Chlat1/8842/Chrsp91S00684